MMKKSVKITLSLVAIVAVVISAWFYKQNKDQSSLTAASSSASVTTTTSTPRDGLSPRAKSSPSNRSAPEDVFQFGSSVATTDEFEKVQFVDGNGRNLTLADFKGKVVLLNIWATWCGPCRKEMPTLDRLQTQLGGSEFQVVALSIDFDGAKVVREFYEEIGISTLKIYVDASGEALQLIKVRGVPTTLLIDRQGSEIGRKTGPAEWDSKPIIAAINQHLNQTESPVISGTVEKAN